MQKADALREHAQAKAAATRNPTLDRLKARSLGKTPSAAVPATTDARGAARHQPLQKPLVR